MTISFSMQQVFLTTDMLVYAYNTCMDTHIQVKVTSQVFSYGRIQVIILSPLTVLVTTEVLLNTRGHA